MEKFEMGPIQKAWIQSLKDHPERQMSSNLAKFENDGSYKACCLGEYLIVECKMTGKEPVIMYDGKLVDNDEDSGSNGRIYYLTTSWQRLGLNSDGGKIVGGDIPNPRYNENDDDDRQYFNSLALANDNGMTWPEIAKFIEENPEKVFTKSI